MSVPAKELQFGDVVSVEIPERPGELQHRVHARVMDLTIGTPTTITMRDRHGRTYRLDVDPYREIILRERPEIVARARYFWGSSLVPFDWIVTRRPDGFFSLLHLVTGAPEQTHDFADAAQLEAMLPASSDLNEIGYGEARSSLLDQFRRAACGPLSTD